MKQSTQIASCKCTTASADFSILRLVDGMRKERRRNLHIGKNHSYVMKESLDIAILSWMSDTASMITFLSLSRAACEPAFRIVFDHNWNIVQTHLFPQSVDIQCDARTSRRRVILKNTFPTFKITKIWCFFKSFLRLSSLLWNWI